jgi:hypothetical protein
VKFYFSGDGRKPRLGTRTEGGGRDVEIKKEGTHEIK